MSDHAKDLMNKGMPWRREANWLVVGLEAVVLIVIGVFILIDRDGARDVILQLIGLVLLVTSVLLGLGNLRREEAGLGFYDAFRSGIGVTVGIVATASWWSEYIADHAVRVILGWGLVAYTLVHVVGLIAVRGRSGLRLGVVVTTTLTLVLGITLLTGDDTTSTGRMTLLGIVLLAFGALLGALAYYLYSRGAQDGPASAGHLASH